jgi:hypothetical protein
VSQQRRLLRNASSPAAGPVRRVGPRYRTGSDRELTVLLQEYSALRAEILSRSTAQHTLLNLDVTILGTIVGLAIAKDSQDGPLLLLLVPLVSGSLGFLYLDHHTAIQRAGVYIDRVIKPPLQRLSRSSDLMSWEDFFNDNFFRRRSSMAVLWTPLAVLFICGPIVSSVFTVRHLGGQAGLIAAWSLGVAIEVFLIVFAYRMFSQRWVRGYRDGIKVRE